MIQYIQLSGFIQNEGFYKSATKTLQEAIVNQRSCVLIASRPDEFKANDERMAHVSNWFKAINIEFEQMTMLDHRVEAQDGIKALMNGACVYLMGGDTKSQMNFITQHGLADHLINHPGVIVGLSAGAINMARLGLVENHVVPHYDKRESDYIENEILPLTFEKVLYGLCENGVIAHSNNGVFYYGDIFELKNGVARQISNGT